ncbi:MAG: HU family DNA-binding protein [Bacteroidales bacterium]|nr:HU family DNA-binding protein [Bacteroidales bacterium]
MNYSYSGSGILHGIVSWSLFTVVSFILLSSAVGAVFSGVGSIVTKSVSGLGSGVEMLVGGSGQQGQAQNLLNLEGVLSQSQNNQQQGQQGENQGTSGGLNLQIMDALRQVFFENGDLNTDIQRQDVVNAIARNSNLTQEEVQEVTNEVMTVYQQAVVQWQEVKQEAEQTADKLASVASKAAIWSFVALVIGAIFAGLGGYLGKPKEDYYATERLRV